GSANQCNQATQDAASFIVPHAGTLNGLALRYDVAVTVGSEMFTVCNTTQGGCSDLALKFTSLTGTGATTVSCTSNCSVNAGDRLAVKFTKSGSTLNATRSGTVLLANSGQAAFMWVGAIGIANQFAFAWSSNAPAGNVNRADRPTTFRNLYAHT